MMTYTQLSNTEPYLIIHADGRITVSEKLQPSETAARVLECMKAQWMEDSQSKQIRELNQRIKQLEEMYEGEPGERPDLLGSNVMGLLKRELTGTQKRIKRMEEVGDEMARWLSSSRNLGDDPFLSHKWRIAKEAKP